MLKSLQPYKIFGCYRFCQSKMALTGIPPIHIFLNIYLFLRHVSLINTFEHVKDALIVILWFLYRLVKSFS